jgi:hypothetical protein
MGCDALESEERRTLVGRHFWLGDWCWRAESGCVDVGAVEWLADAEGSGCRVVLRLVGRSPWWWKLEDALANGRAE